MKKLCQFGQLSVSGHSVILGDPFVMGRVTAVSEDQTEILARFTAHDGNRLFSEVALLRKSDGHTILGVEGQQYPVLGGEIARMPEVGDYVLVILDRGRDGLFASTWGRRDEWFAALGSVGLGKKALSPPAISPVREIERVFKPQPATVVEFITTPFVPSTIVKKVHGKKPVERSVSGRALNPVAELGRLADEALQAQQQQVG